MATGARKELLVEGFLELADLAGQRRLGQAQRLGGA